MKGRGLIMGMIALSLLVNSTFAKTEEKAQLTLQVELKDPHRAYSAALIPILGPQMAAKYVGTTRFQWKVSPEIQRKANMYTFVNVLTLVGGLGVGLLARDQIDDEVLSVGVFLAGYLLSWIGPLIENQFFASYCANKAIEFNRKQYERFGITPPEPR